MDCGQAATHYHDCPGVKGLAPTMVIFGLVAGTNAFMKFCYKIPRGPREQKVGRVPVVVVVVYDRVNTLNDR